MSRAWVVRAGQNGEQEEGNLRTSTASIGWRLPDLGPTRTRDEVRAMMEAEYPDASPGRLANYTGQVWAFRNGINAGDLVVMPSKLRPGYLYVGECTGAYRFAAEDPDPRRRHQIPVNWRTDPVAKSAVKDDLLSSLNSIMTVFNPTRNNAAARVRALLDDGRDPGNTFAPPSRTAATIPGPGSSGSVRSYDDSDELASGDESVRDPDAAPTLEAIRDRIRTHLVENFGGHKLTWLVADILEALGYRCEVSPPGPDGGVDILAGRGPLGLDSPTLIVEVKSEPTPIDVKVLRGLHSAMTQHRADQGLLVAFGGLTKPAQREFERERAWFRTWDSEELLDQLLENYDRLSARTQAQIPLKQTWVLQSDTD